MILRSLAVVVVLAGPALADPAKPPAAPAVVLDGRFGFDVFKPTRRCVKVAGPLLAKLRTGYRCAPPDNGGQTGSGVVFVATCTVKKGPESEYMLFNSAADCDKERETQLANAG